MYRAVKLFVVVLAMLVVTRVQAQDTLGFRQAIDSMTVLMHSAALSPDVVEKQKLSDEFRTLLVETLKKEGSFNFTIDSIPHVGILTSTDSLVRVFTWGVPTTERALYLYYGVVQRRASKQTKISDVFVLEDTKSRVVLPEQETMKYPSWYGCIYYQMVEKSDGKNVYYTLIGGDFNGGVSYKKYIDVLTFDKYANPIFGAPIFVLDKKPQKRVVFEYTAQSVMLVRYFADLDKIVFNYLYPIVEEKKNDKKYYVPDATYEGLMFKLGKWMKVPNVDFSRKE